MTSQENRTRASDGALACEDLTQFSIMQEVLWVGKRR